MCGYVIGSEVGEFSKSYSSFIFEVEQNKNREVREKTNEMQQLDVYF